MALVLATLRLTVVMVRAREERGDGLCGLAPEDPAVWRQELGFIPWDILPVTGWISNKCLCCEINAL